jgi:hypothetical protein
MFQQRKLKLAPLGLFLAQLTCVPLASAQTPAREATVPADTSTAEAPAAIQSVTVSGVKDPEIKSYLALISGLDAFEKYRRLAPDAPELRFRLSAAPTLSSIDVKSIVLQLRSDNLTIPIPVAADGTFVLPRNKAAEDENADLVLNKTKGQVRGRPEIRTPGIPENMRRLGDLRLECEVYFAIAKHEMNIVQRAAIATVTLGRGLCRSKRMHMGFPAIDTIKALTLVSGNKRVPLKAGMPNFFGRHYFPPVGDDEWPDDTLLEFELGQAESLPADKPTQ